MYDTLLVILNEVRVLLQAAERRLEDAVEIDRKYLGAANQYRLADIEEAISKTFSRIEDVIEIAVAELEREV